MRYELKFLHKKIDWNNFGIVYAGVQKNLGPAGVTLVVIREDLIGDEMDITPEIMNYKLQAEAPGQ